MGQPSVGGVDAPKANPHAFPLCSPPTAHLPKPVEPEANPSMPRLGPEAIGAWFSHEAVFV